MIPIGFFLIVYYYSYCDKWQAFVVFLVNYPSQILEILDPYGKSKLPFVKIRRKESLSYPVQLLGITLQNTQVRGEKYRSARESKHSLIRAQKKTKKKQKKKFPMSVFHSCKYIYLASYRFYLNRRNKVLHDHYIYQ